MDTKGRLSLGFVDREVPSEKASSNSEIYSIPIITLLDDFFLIQREVIRNFHVRAVIVVRYVKKLHLANRYESR
jgi:hypothetical protein